MRLSTFRFSAAAAAILLSVSACTGLDSTTAPGRSIKPHSAPSATLLGSPATVDPLLRTTSLSSPITVTKTIGVLGGSISIPAAGVTVVVPALALTSNKSISVTAVAGNKVAYEFAPHGLVFNVPLVMTQDLSKTQARPGGLVNPLDLFVGYFPNSSNITSITEILSVSLDITNQTAISTIRHFSGYIIAGGRQEEE